MHAWAIHIYGILILGTNGGVRLYGGIVPEAGTVEYCTGGTWKAVCDSNWDYKDSFVVCRQLGFPATGNKNHFCMHT